MAKKSKATHYAEAFIGMDMQGDPCIYVQWINKTTGKVFRFLNETELKALLREQSNIPIGGD